MNFAVANDHHCLWRLLSKSALGKQEYVNAYQCFVHCGDYHGVQLIKRLEVRHSLTVSGRILCRINFSYKTDTKLNR